MPERSAVSFRDSIGKLTNAKVKNALTAVLSSVV
jgi:hypothetical protein